MHQWIPIFVQTVFLYSLNCQTVFLSKLCFHTLLYSVFCIVMRSHYSANDARGWIHNEDVIGQIYRTITITTTSADIAQRIKY